MSVTEVRVREILKQELEIEMAIVRRDIVEKMMDAVVFKQQKVEDTNERRNEYYIGKFTEFEHKLLKNIEENTAMINDLSANYIGKVERM